MFYNFFNRRRGSFQSLRSVPTLTLEGRASGRSTKSDSSKLRRNKNKNKNAKPHSEVGIRTVHTAYKAHHGFLALLKQRFSRSSSRDRDRDGIGFHETTQSSNATPEMSRRPLVIDHQPPEIVRIRNEVPAANSASTSGEVAPSVEIFRHCVAVAAADATIAPEAAEVVRHKMTTADQVK
jgi:hypothetical protein